mgnify:CR=1 FL=1
MTATQIDPYNPALAGHMVTSSGIIVNLMDVDPDSINLQDIATGLANCFRWNGHVWPGYSVAQHCCSMHDNLPSLAVEQRLDVLFHDSEEAYWGDIIKPVKMILKDKCPELLEIMRETRRVIYKKFGVVAHPETKHLDDIELRYEWEILVLNKRPDFWVWSPQIARNEWLKRVSKLITIK